MKIITINADEIKNNQLILLFVASIIINLLSVLIHEFGHAIIYLMQGYQIEYHFTKMDPINGTETVFGAASGIVTNFIVALISLFLFCNFSKVLFYLIIVANTLFCRVLIGLLFVLAGKSLSDETFLGKSIQISPVYIELIVVVVLAVIFIISTVILFKKYRKGNSLRILGIVSISSIVTLILIIIMDEKQI